jgi:hypothetical protein
MKRLLAAVALALVTGPVLAQDPPPAPVPEPPELPPGGYSGETVEPEVTIMETERGTVYEYRVRGQLYMVRVQPQFGPPYYLLDTNGDGTLDVRGDRPWNNAVPQWLIHSW